MCQISSILLTATFNMNQPNLKKQQYWASLVNWLFMKAETWPQMGIGFDAVGP